MNNEFEETWEESSVVGFKTICQNLLRKAKAKSSENCSIVDEIPERTAERRLKEITFRQWWCLEDWVSGWTVNGSKRVFKWNCAMFTVIGRMSRGSYFLDLLCLTNDIKIYSTFFCRISRLKLCKLPENVRIFLCV